MKITSFYNFFVVKKYGSSCVWLGEGIKNMKKITKRVPNEARYENSFSINILDEQNHRNLRSKIFSGLFVDCSYQKIEIWWDYIKHIKY